MRFEVRFGNERLITPTGLGIAGLLLKKTDLKRRLNEVKFKAIRSTNIFIDEDIGGLNIAGKVVEERRNRLNIIILIKKNQAIYLTNILSSQ
jgi:hypothetical protein